jgi:aryl-alcohol dehydrogenase-like predicted oxidoreductase
MTSISIADQDAIERTLPIAREKQMGVIAKRPIANAAWIYRSATEAKYPEHIAYWERLEKLDFDFLRGPARSNRGAGGPGDIALRFTLGQEGVGTAIVGTSNPDRYRQNAELVGAGPLPASVIDGIRARWKAVAGEDWVGIE